MGREGGYRGEFLEVRSSEIICIRVNVCHHRDNFLLLYTCETRAPGEEIGNISGRRVNVRRDGRFAGTVESSLPGLQEVDGRVEKAQLISFPLF